MNEFNLLVLNIASIVLIIALIVVGIILYYSVRDSKFPPFETACPSYYMLDPSGNTCIAPSSNTVDSLYKQIPGNLSPFSKLDTVSPQCVTVPLSKFSGPNFTDADKLCAKKKWAHGCSVFWDGVTNNPNACIKHSDNLFMSGSNFY